MNFVFAVIIGLVIGGVGGYVLRQRHPNAIWLTPVLAVVGSVIASILASLFGDAGYGPKEITLQVVLAAAGVGVVAALGARRRTPAASSGAGAADR